MVSQEVYEYLKGEYVRRTGTDMEPYTGPKDHDYEEAI